MELGDGVALSLEGTVAYVGAVVVHVRHDWLAHGTVPLHVAWLSKDVSPGGLVVLMVHWCLACSPLAVRIWHWWVLREHSRQVPVEQVWVVGEGLHVEWMVVHHDWAVRSETTAETSNKEPHGVAVGNKASSIKVFDWELTDHHQTKRNAHLSAGSVVSPVKVGSVDWSGHLGHLAAGEPSSKDSQLSLSQWSPGWHLFLKSVLGHTEADKFVVLHVGGNLWVNLSLLEVIVSILHSVHY